MGQARAGAEPALYAHVARVAASLAKLGLDEDARRVMQHLLRIKTDLTVAKIRWRLRHMHDSVLTPFSPE